MGSAGRESTTVKARGGVAGTMSETVELVRRSLSAEAREEFDRRVEAGADYLREELRSGNLDNADPTIGMELECYVVDPEGRLGRLPEGCLDGTPVNRELGKHNVEVNTPPTVLDDDGVAAQAATIHEHLATGRHVVAEHDRRIVLDAMWTVPPPEGTRAYLSDVEEVDGVVLASNMHEAPRYHALDNEILERGGGTVELDLPGVRESFPTIMAESLATSIQPHLQVPDVETFPAFYNAAIRTLGPVLALATNSPFLPADLYDDVEGEAAHELIDATYHELRVPVFEQSINAGREPGKVRFPGDVDGPEDAIDRIVADDTLAPFLREWVAEEADVEGWSGDDDGSADVDGEARETHEDRREEDENEVYTDAFWEFDQKHGTYWRWLRGVFGGDVVDDANDERSLRIEYRPLPTQPSVRDVVGLQCLVSGLLLGVVEADHPLATLEWSRARETFYDVVEAGLDADLHWVTADGEHTTDPELVYGDVFDLARRGLEAAGVSREVREQYLRPIEVRWEGRATPSAWKIERVRRAVDEGRSLADGIRRMQREYVDRAASTRPFVEWR